MYAKADPGLAPPLPPHLKKKMGLVFCKFSLYIRKYFDFSQHAVFTIIYKLFTYSSNKNIGYV